MTIHHIYRRQPLALNPQQAWDFFSSPRYLNSMTPDFFQVSIESVVPDKIYAGLLICYQMQAVFDIPITWVSDISHCDEPRRFVYRQLMGPFKFWNHEVCISEYENGIVMEDIVCYAMPFGLLGEWLHHCFIGSQLQQIFTHRAQYLQEQWGTE